MVGDNVYAAILEAMAAERAPIGASDDDPPELGPEEWRRLFQVADWHRVIPVLGRRALAVRERAGGSAELLRLGAAQDAARQLALGQARAQVARLLDARQVPAMFLKGAALVETVYPPGIVRDMSDLDVLVHDSQLTAAQEALRGAGFRTIGAPAAGSVGNAPPRHEAKMVDAAGLVSVELHRYLIDGADRNAYPVEDVWSRARRSGLGPHLLPCEEDLLLHVCLHFLAGRSVRSEGALGQIRDVAWIAQAGGVDWQRLDTLALRYGMPERTRLVLRIARLLGQLPECPLLPEDSAEDARAARFLRARVLTDRARPPVGSWTPDVAGFRNALWWSRKHLGEVPAGELPDVPDRLAAAVIQRRVAARRLATELLRNPAATGRELRMASWLRTLT